MARLYKKVIQSTFQYPPELTVDVYNCHDGRPIFNYSIPMCLLTTDEVKLNEGRFERFQDKLEGYEVVTGAGSAFYPRTYFKDALEWIADSTSDRWFFDVDFKDVWNGKIIWTFASRVDALRFAFGPLWLSPDAEPTESDVSLLA